MASGTDNFLTLKICAFLFIVGIILSLIGIYDQNLSDKNKTLLKAGGFFLIFLAVVIFMFYIFMFTDNYY